VEAIGAEFRLQPYPECFYFFGFSAQLRGLSELNGVFKHPVQLRRERAPPLRKKRHLLETRADFKQLYVKDTCVPDIFFKIPASGDTAVLEYKYRDICHYFKLFRAEMATSPALLPKGTSISTYFTFLICFLPVYEAFESVNTGKSDACPEN